MNVNWLARLWPKDCICDGNEALWIVNGTLVPFQEVRQNVVPAAADRLLHVRVQSEHAGRVDAAAAQRSTSTTLHIHVMVARVVETPVRVTSSASSDSITYSMEALPLAKTYEIRNLRRQEQDPGTKRPAVFENVGNRPALSRLGN